MDVQQIKESFEQLRGIIAIDKTATTDEAKSFQNEFLKAIDDALLNMSEVNVEKVIALSSIYTKAQQNLAVTHDVSAMYKTIAADVALDTLKSVTSDAINAVSGGAQTSQPSVVAAPVLQSQPVPQPVQTQTQTQPQQASFTPSAADIAQIEALKAQLESMRSANTQVQAN